MKKSKVIIAMTSVSAGANPFLDADGHVNIDRIAALQEKVKAMEENFPTTKPNGKPAKPPRPETIYVRLRKAKTTKFSSGSQKKGDLKYLTQRAVKIGTVRRITEKNQIRNLPMLTVYDSSLMGKLAPQIKQAVSAITKHMKSAEKTKTGVKKVKDKARDEGNKVFAVSLTAIKKILLAGGVKDKDLIESKGMYGMSMLVNLGGDNVISIGKSDASKFKAAKKAAAAAE